VQCPLAIGTVRDLRGASSRPLADARERMRMRRKKKTSPRARSAAYPARAVLVAGVTAGGVAPALVCVEVDGSDPEVGGVSGAEVV